MKTILIALSVLGAAGCSHLIKFTGATPDPTADEAFARELDRLDAEVRACYAKVIVKDPVPIELAVDEAGYPLAARAMEPFYGTTLGGCLETVAFRANLPPGTTRRLARATASLKPRASGEGLSQAARPRL